MFVRPNFALLEFKQKEFASGNETAVKAGLSKATNTNYNTIHKNTKRCISSGAMNTITKANSNVIFVVFLLSICKIRSKKGVGPINVACGSFASENIHVKQTYSTI